jgi:DDE domain
MLHLGEDVPVAVELRGGGPVRLYCVGGSGAVPKTGGMMKWRSGSSAPSGYRFPREVIAVAVRWYLRYGLSFGDEEELLAERGITVDHVTIYRWVQTFTSEFIDAARPARHAAGHRWFVDETYVKVAGRWTYVYRAVDHHGQVIAGRAARNQVAVQDRVHLILQPGPLPDDVRGAQYLATQRAGRRIGQPHRRQEGRSQQPGQDLGVDLVGLDLRFGDRSRLDWIGHHHPAGVAGQQRRDRARVPGRLQRYLIRRSEVRGEPADPLRCGREPPGPTHHPALPDRDLREVAVHIQRWAKRHLPIRARRTRAGRRGGHLTTRALSPARNTGLPTLISLAAPLSRTVAPYADPVSPTRGERPAEPAAQPLSYRPTTLSRLITAA